MLSYISFQIQFDCVKYLHSQHNQISLTFIEVLIYYAFKNIIFIIFTFLKQYTGFYNVSAECYDCDHVLTTETCNHSRICQAGEVNYILNMNQYTIYVIDLSHEYWPFLCLSSQVCVIRDRISNFEFQVCFTLETLNFDLEHGYRMGCVHQRVIL